MAILGLVIQTDGFDYEAHDDEIVRLLRVAAEKIENGMEHGVLVDRDGNTVGTFTLG